MVVLSLLLDLAAGGSLGFFLRAPVLGGKAQMRRAGARSRMVRSIALSA